MIPSVAGEVGSHIGGHGGPALDRGGAAASGSPHGAHRRDSGWRGLHGAGGGEEVTVRGRVLSRELEVLGEGLVQIVIVRLWGGREREKLR